jgi:hypothetical protein
MVSSVDVGCGVKSDQIKYKRLPLIVVIPFFHSRSGGRNYMLLRLYTFFLVLLLISCTSEGESPSEDAMEELPCSGAKFVTGHFNGICASSVPSWAELSLAGTGIDTDHHRIAGLCNPNGFGLRLYLEQEVGWVEIDVAPNDCTDEWTFVDPRVFVVPLDPWLELTAACGEASERMPVPIQVEVSLACELPMNSTLQ